MYAVRRSSKLLSRVLTVLLLLVTIAIWYHVQRWTRQSVTATASIVSVDRVPCQSLQLDDVAVVVKMGASEAFEKLSAQLETTLTCAKNSFIMSDLAGSLNGQPIVDVLQDVHPSIRDHHPAFEIYHAQRRLQEQGFGLEYLVNPLNDSDRSRVAAWEFDKWKFLHMMAWTHSEQPGKQWYIFIEADTYLNWNNLGMWLRQLNASEELYIGSPSFMSGTKFNHGGSGYVLSKPALRRLAEYHSQIAKEWDERISHECCGDYVLTLALNELGIAVQGVWPMLSGEPPLELPFGPALWCQPVISLHHVTPAELRKLWAFDQDRNRQTQNVLFQDLYNQWLPHGLPEMKHNWDNRCPGSVFDIHDLPSNASTSLEACRDACDAVPHCMQHFYRQDECRLYKCFTLGKSVEPQDGKSWNSGWRLDRINAWISEHTGCTPAWIQHTTTNARHAGFV